MTAPRARAFEALYRRLSHGCVRVERALDSIDFLLAADPDSAQQALDGWLPWSQTRKVVVPHPIPVRLVYFTAGIDEAGVLQLRDDVYGRDAELRSLVARVARERRAAPPSMVKGLDRPPAPAPVAEAAPARPAAGPPEAR